MYRILVSAKSDNKKGLANAATHKANFRISVKPGSRASVSEYDSLLLTGESDPPLTFFVEASCCKHQDYETRRPEMLRIDCCCGA